MPLSDGRSSQPDSFGHWVFGFGSLMWQPGFAYEERRAARVHGWHRQFSVVSTRSWGSENCPGLVVALHPGGSCLGLAFRVAADLWPETLAYLRQREQAYRFVEVSAKLTNSTIPASVTAAAAVQAVTFASDPSHPRTAPTMSYSHMAKLIAQGSGSNGTSRHYFDAVKSCLEEMGQKESELLMQISKHLS